jgi:3-dehydroquinate dehydratase I
MHYLTLPVRAKTPKEAINLMATYKNQVDAFELWMDFLKPKHQNETSIQQIVKATKRPILVVCKSPQESGHFYGSDSRKVDLLLLAAQAGAKWVDINLGANKSQIIRLQQEGCMGTNSCGLVLSYHNFFKTPSKKNLQLLVQKAKDLKADIIKIATQVNSAGDKLLLINLAKKLKAQKQKHIIIGMGELGKSTRILSKSLGNLMSFVSTTDKTAPGQLSITQAKSPHTILKQ